MVAGTAWFRLDILKSVLGLGYTVICEEQVDFGLVVNKRSTDDYSARRKFLY
jgi:hypothetical protein